MSIGGKVKMAKTVIDAELMERAKALVKRRKRAFNDITASERALIWRYQVECENGEYISTRDIAKLIGCCSGMVSDITKKMREQGHA